MRLARANLVTKYILPLRYSILSKPPSDTPYFEKLGHEQHRAIIVWLFLRRNHGKWFTAKEIAEDINLADSTVTSALSRIFDLPPLLRSRLQRRTIDDERGRRKQYRFMLILKIIFDEQETNSSDQ